MLTENQNIIIDNIDTSNKTISIAKNTIILKNGIEIAKKRDRRAFVPGEIEEVKAYLELEESPEIDYLNAIWTPEVIAEYQANLESSQ